MYQIVQLRFIQYSTVTMTEDMIWGRLLRLSTSLSMAFGERKRISSAFSFLILSFSSANAFRSLGVKLRTRNSSRGVVRPSVSGVQLCFFRWRVTRGEGAAGVRGALFLAWVSTFWAAAPKGTKSCRTQGDFRSSVRSIVRPPPQASNQASQGSNLASQA